MDMSTMGLPPVILTRHWTYRCTCVCCASSQALENRISEGDVQRVRLKEELDGKDAQLQRAEHEVSLVRVLAL